MNNEYAFKFHTNGQFSAYYWSGKWRFTPKMVSIIFARLSLQCSSEHFSLLYDSYSLHLFCNSPARKKKLKHIIIIYVERRTLVKLNSKVKTWNAYKTCRAYFHLIGREKKWKRSKSDNRKRKKKLSYSTFTFELFDKIVSISYTC